MGVESRRHGANDRLLLHMLDSQGRSLLRKEASGKDNAIRLGGATAWEVDVIQRHGFGEVISQGRSIDKATSLSVDTEHGLAEIRIDATTGSIAIIDGNERSAHQGCRIRQTNGAASKTDQTGEFNASKNRRNDAAFLTEHERIEHLDLSGVIELIDKRSINERRGQLTSKVARTGRVFKVLKRHRVNVGVGKVVRRPSVITNEPGKHIAQNDWIGVSETAIVVSPTKERRSQPELARGGQPIGAQFQQATGGRVARVTTVVTDSSGRRRIARSL